jgi:hypothetical protein
VHSFPLLSLTICQHPCRDLKSHIASVLDLHPDWPVKSSILLLLPEFTFISLWDFFHDRIFFELGGLLREWLKFQTSPGCFAIMFTVGTVEVFYCRNKVVIFLMLFVIAWFCTHLMAHILV